LYGYRFIGLLGAGLNVIGLIVAYFCLRDNKCPEDEGVIIPSSTLAKPECSVVMQLGELMQTNTKLTLLQLLNFLQALAYGVYACSAPIYLRDVYSYSGKDFALTMCVSTVIVIFVQAFLVKPTVAAVGPCNGLLLGCMSGTAGALLLVTISAWWVPCLSFSLMGISMQLGNPCSMPIANLIAPQAMRGLVLGTVQSLQALGHAIGPLISGALYEEGKIVPFLVGPSITTLCTLLAATLGMLLMEEELESDEDEFVRSEPSKIEGMGPLVRKISSSRGLSWVQTTYNTGVIGMPSTPVLTKALSLGIIKPRSTRSEPSSYRKQGSTGLKHFLTC